jgi:stage II sporulation protein AB (anti-sigma F factor)
MRVENVQVDTMEFINEMKLCFQARSENESFARVAVAGFLTYLDPTVEELEDIKTAVSEAVTNAIIHGYDEKETATVYVSCIIYRDGGEHVLQVVVEDTGKGIADIEQAMEPMFTTRPELERSGMGFTFMNAFMDEVQVQSEIMKGTTVTLFKRLRRFEEHIYEEG